MDNYIRYSLKNLCDKNIDVSLKIWYHGSIMIENGKRYSYETYFFIDMMLERTTHFIVGFPDEVENK